jgi:mannan endo-1,6-alpha-mannosidase
MGSTWDGTYGFGQQFDALEAIQSLLIEESVSPVTAHTGGISHGDASAGTGGDFAPGPPSLTRPITTGDRAGAGILTAFVLISWVAVIWWMV